MTSKADCDDLYALSDEAVIIPQPTDKLPHVLISSPTSVSASCEVGEEAKLTREETQEFKRLPSTTPGMFAESCAASFALKIKNEFRDGSVSKQFKSRVEALATPTAQYAAPTPCATPSTQSSPVAALTPPSPPQADESSTVPQRFAFPWARLALLLALDAIDATKAATGELSEDFTDLESLSVAVERAQLVLTKSCAEHISSLTVSVNRTYFQRTLEDRLADSVVQPCLVECTQDSVLPKLRYLVQSGSTTTTNEKSTADPEKDDAMETKKMICVSALGQALTELFVSYVAAYYPIVHHLCKTQKEKTCVLAKGTTAAQGGSVVWSLKQRRDIAALVRRSAMRRDLWAESTGGIYSRAVLVPAHWIDQVVNWLKEEKDESSLPPVIPTWKLMRVDAENGDLVLCPRKESASKPADCQVEALPEGLFSCLWETFGGGPKLVASNVRCDDAQLKKLQDNLAPATLAVSLIVPQGVLAKCIQESSLTPTQSSGTTRDLTLHLGELPEYLTVWDALVVAAQHVEKLWENDDGNNDKCWLRTLGRSLTYGHCELDEVALGIPTLTSTWDTDSNGYQFRSTSHRYAAESYLLSTTIGSIPETRRIPVTEDDMESPTLNNDEEVIQLRIVRLTMNVNPGLCGLDNLGNTCFMNSGLQCLANVPQFRNELLRSCWTKQWPSSTTPLTFQFTNVVRSLWQGTRRSVAPSKFKEALGVLCPRFSGYEQQDAIELIEVLLDRLNDEVNPVDKKKFRERTDEDANIDAKTLSDIYWNDFLANNNTFVTRLMYRQERTRFECLTCGHKHAVFDAQSSLPIPISEEQFVSLDVQVLFCPAAPTAATNEEEESAYQSFPSTGGSCVNAAAEGDGEEKEEKEARHQIAEEPAPLSAASLASANTYLRVRVRVPTDSNYAVVLSEVRRVLIDSHLVSKVDAKNILLFYHTAYSGQWLSALSSGSMLTVKRGDATRFLSVVAPSYHAVAKRIEEHQQRQLEDSKTSNTNFNNSVNNYNASSAAAANGLDHYARVMFFLHDGTETDSQYYPTTSPTASTSSTPSTSSPSNASSSASGSREKWSFVCHVEYFERTTVTNRSIWEVAERACRRFTRVRQTVVATAADDNNAEDDGSSLHAHEQEGERVPPPVATAHDSTAPSTHADPHASGTRMLASSPPSLMTASPFIVQVLRNNYDRPESVPCNDDAFSFPSFTSYEVSSLRVCISLQPAPAPIDGEASRNEEEKSSSAQSVASPAAQGAASLELVVGEPISHETMRTVAPNEIDARNPNSGMTLEKCLRNMRETHVLKGDNSWYCPKCKEHRESTNETAHFILPEVLTLHLKRFKATMYGTMSKIDTVVQFPLELDMGTYLEEDVAAAQKGSTQYALRSVVYHSGSLSYGHYTAMGFCEGVDAWVTYNDSSAYVSSSPPRPEGAYILFYQRVQPDEVFSNNYYGRMPPTTTTTSSMVPQIMPPCASETKTNDVADDEAPRHDHVAATAPPPPLHDGYDDSTNVLHHSSSIYETD